MIYTRYIKQVLLNMNLLMVQYQYENVISRRTTSNNMTEITLRNGSIHSFPNEVFSYRSHDETCIFFRRPTEEEEVLPQLPSYTDTKPDGMVIYNSLGNIHIRADEKYWIHARLHILKMPEVTDEMLKKYAYAKSGDRGSEHGWYYISTKAKSVRAKNANDSAAEIKKIIQCLGYTIDIKCKKKALS